MSVLGSAGQLRRARADDAPAVAACVDRAFRPYIESLGRAPAPMFDDYSEIIRRHAVTLAIVDSTIAGVLVLKLRAHDCLIDNIAVDPDFQARGVGRQLITHAEDEARAAGHTRLVTYTNVAMTRNRLRYSQLGFKEYAQVREYGYQRVYMRKTLPDIPPVQ